MTKLKIALISEHASPLAILGGVDSGGQNVYVAQVARNLARLGYQVDVFTRRDSEELEEIFDWESGVRIIHVPAGPAEFVPKEKLYQYMQEFTNFMVDFIHRQREPYDLVHANFWMSGLVAADLKRITGIPFIITFHALGRVRRIHQGEKDGFPDIRFEVEDRIVNEADAIIAECPQDEQDLRELYHADPTKIAIIPCGFEPSEFWPIDKELARMVLGIPSEERVLLQLGRMVPRKGVDNAILGLASLINDHDITARLIIVGGESEDADPALTPEIGRLKAIAEREGVAEYVTFAGHRDRQALKYYYSAADIFISTPWYEPFGITPVEAMACGTPVIGSNVGGIKFTILDGKTGYLVPPNEPNLLADRVAHLYKHPEKLTLFSQRAIERANELFTWAKVAQSVASVYEEIIISLHPLPAISNAPLVRVALPQIEPSVMFDYTFKDALKALHRSRKMLEDVTLRAAEILTSCLSQGGRIFVCGNGGSSADAQHFMAEFIGRFIFPNRKALPVMALTTDTTLLTDWANDINYEQVFSRQLEAFAQPGDAFIGISTSGHSGSLINAIKTAQHIGMSRIALLGGDGGECATLVDIPIVVPSVEPARIQEVQILLLHLLVELLEGHFFPEHFMDRQFLSRKIPSPSTLVGSVTGNGKSTWGLGSTVPVNYRPTG